MTGGSPDVVVTLLDESNRMRSSALAERLALPFVETAWESAHRFALAYNAKDRLALYERREPHTVGMVVRFDDLPIRHGRIAVSKDEPLGRAFGPKVRTILDATAGLGHDAFLLACMGFEVTAVERSPVVAALFEDGLRRAIEDGRLRVVAERIRILAGDARDIMIRLEPHDAVYLDPMFPPKRKKAALAKKPMRLLRELVGDDSDTRELFDAATRAARQRVVVKRADDAPPIAPKPVASVPGKMVRYDIYSPQAALASVMRIE